MDLATLRSALAVYFFRQGYRVLDGATTLDLLLAKEEERLGLLLCPEREEGMAFLGAFEAAMQRAVDARRAQPTGLGLGLGVSFGSAAAGQRPSYRQALKKYSNSIVFEDLGLALYLVQSAEKVIALPPGQVNPFLGGLDRWITGQR